MHLIGHPMPLEPEAMLLAVVVQLSHGPLAAPPPEQLEAQYEVPAPGATAQDFPDPPRRPLSGQSILLIPVQIVVGGTLYPAGHGS